MAKNQLLHSHASPRTLIFAIQFMFVVWMVRYLIDPMERLSELPIEYTAPVGALGLLPLTAYLGLHSFVGLLLLRVGIVVCAMAVLVPRTRLRGAIFGCVLLFIATAVARGFGHINHAEIAPLLVTGILTYFMACLPRAQILAPTDRPNEHASAGLILATLCLALTYTFVGVARMLHGGFDLLAGDTITLHMIRMSHHDWLFSYNVSQLLLGTGGAVLALKLGTAAVTVFEIAAPISLISQRFRWAFLALMPLFHIGAILVFKIDFIENVLTMMLFLNLTELTRPRGIRGQSTVAQVASSLSTSS